MKNRISRICGITLAAITAATMSASVLEPVMTVHAEADPGTASGGVRSVELGIRALTDPVNGGGEWNGTHIYFGNQGNYPISFRVLDTNPKIPFDKSKQYADLS